MFDLKVEVLTHYGNGKLACVRCGFTDLRALSIDHMNGGGAKHIRSLHKPFYEWLVENDYPEGYRTLCMNCQWIHKGQKSKRKHTRRRDDRAALSIGRLAQSSLLDWIA